MIEPSAEFGAGGNLLQPEINSRFLLSPSSTVREKKLCFCTALAENGQKFSLQILIWLKSQWRFHLKFMQQDSQVFVRFVDAS